MGYRGKREAMPGRGGGGSYSGSGNRGGGSSSTDPKMPAMLLFGVVCLRDGLHFHLCA